MFNRIVAGVDSHQGGRDAVALAERLRGPTGKLTLARVCGQDEYMYRGVSLAYEHEEAAEIREDLDRLRLEADVEADVQACRAPSVGHGLHELCETVGAELLVVGSSRRGLLGRVLVGDDTREALNGAPCALAVAPLGYATQPQLMREVGVAYNGSPESEHALGVGRRIATEHHAKLSAFEAIVFPSYAYLPDPESAQSMLEELVEQAKARIRGRGEVEAHAAYGLPVEELALYSASVDLLIIGSRGYGPIGRLIHGSVSQQLLRHTRSPVLILTRATRRAEAAPTEAAEAT